MRELEVENVQNQIMPILANHNNFRDIISHNKLY